MGEWLEALRKWRPLHGRGLMTDALSRASQAMDRYAQGDQSAFAIVYDELASRLFAYVMQLTGSKSSAEDVLQQVFLNMHRARGRFIPGARVEPWAYAIAQRLAIDSARRGHRSAPLAAADSVLSTGVDPEGAATGAQLERALASAMEAIPPAQREAFLLTRIHGFSSDEAARELGTTATTAKVRSHRAGLELRRRLLRFSRAEKPR